MFLQPIFYRYHDTLFGSSNLTPPVFFFSWLFFRPAQANSIYFFVAIFMGFCSYRAVEPLVEQLCGVGASTDLDEAGIIKDATYVPEHELRP